MKVLARIFLLTAVEALEGAHAQAHVNWFVESGSEPVENYAISDPVFLFWSGLVIGLVCFSTWLDGRLPTLRIVDSKTRRDFMELLRILTGMSFLLTAYEGALAAPHQAVSVAFGTLLLFLQAEIGIILIANRWIKLAAVAMLVLHFGVAVEFGLMAALEYAIFIGIALFLLFNAFEDPVRSARFKPFSIDALRIWTVPCRTACGREARADGPRPELCRPISMQFHVGFGDRSF